VTFENLERYREDIETCFGTSCNFCERACPVYQIQKRKTLTARGRNRTILGILYNKLQPSTAMAETSYQCAMCGACERWCALPDTTITSTFREYLINKGFENDFHKSNYENIKQYGNPYGDENKSAWMEGLQTNEESSTLYFAGCTQSLKSQEVLQLTIKLLGTNVKIMQNEPCCGCYLIKTGYTSMQMQLWEQFLDYVEKNMINEIITTCPGCYSTIKDSLEKSGVGSKVHVVHATEKIAERLEEFIHKRNDNERLFAKVTYHDPCHLGRLGGIFEAPRRILRCLCEEVVEMEHNRYDSHCCGAGGGLMASFRNLSEDIGKKRIEEAKKTGAEILATACPFCELQFKSLGGIEVKNVFELLYRYGECNRGLYSNVDE
jgi:Fe-S oxidoreductase